MRILIIALVLASVACQDDSSARSNVRIYSTVTEATVNSVIDGYRVANPGVTIELFRAPTGEVTARIAAELREGGIQADVLWLTDPLSMQGYQAEGLLREWTPSEVDAIPGQYRTASYFGTRLVNMVIVAGKELDSPPTDWRDLATIEGGIAIPDPAFAGSAFAALAYFANTAGYGLDYYEDLVANGVVQVQSPTDVVTGVAEGIYAAGMALDQGVRTAIADGSPITLIWPESGAIAIESPITVVDQTGSASAESFVDFVLSAAGQAAIANTGWQPIRTDVPWTANAGEARGIDWVAAFAGQENLIDQYAAIFGP